MRKLKAERFINPITKLDNKRLLVAGFGKNSKKYNNISKDQKLSIVEQGLILYTINIK